MIPEPNQAVQSSAPDIPAMDLTRFLEDRIIDQRIEPGVFINGPASLTPGRRGALSFCTGVTPQHCDSVRLTQSSVILVKRQVLEALRSETAPSTIAVDDPRREFARAVTYFFTRDGSGGVSQHAVVDETAQIGPNTSIGSGAYIAPGVLIGRNCRIGANTVLLEGTVIGDDTSVGPNCTIGYVGFGYAREQDGSPVLVPHSGGVLIGSHVDIGANTCIDRGTLNDTIIEDHVKIDNLVHIAHNCRIEKGAFVIATAILCGGVQIGPRAWVAPNASVREQLRVGADAVVGLASTVVKHVPDGATVVGSPARQVHP